MARGVVLVAALCGDALAQPAPATTPTTPTLPTTPSAPSAPTTPSAPAPRPPDAADAKKKPAEPAIPDVFLPPRERYKMFYGGYPLELVDRPLVAPAGVTVFAPSYQFRTHVADGRRTGFAADRNLDLELSHVFGPVDVGVGLGFRARGFAAMAIPHMPLAVWIAAGFTAPQADHRYSHTQSVGLRFKRAVVPRRLALALRTSGSAIEERNRDALGATIEGVVLIGSAQVDGEVQLSRSWCVYGGFGADLPFYKTAFDPHPSLDANLSINFAVWKWDFFVNTSLGDITRRGPSTFINIGFAKRWGI